jgi:hypothetical protein
MYSANHYLKGRGICQNKLEMNLKKQCSVLRKLGATVSIHVKQSSSNLISCEKSFQSAIYLQAKDFMCNILIKKYDCLKLVA